MTKRSTIAFLVIAAMMAILVIGVTVPRQDKHVNLLIVGTELEGLYMAKRAHEEGLKVLVVEPAPYIGGQLLQADMMYLDEPYDRSGHSLVQGLMKDLFNKYYKGDIRKRSQFQAYVDGLLAGIPLEKGTALSDIGTAGRKVNEVTLTSGNGKSRTVQVDYIVDNTDSAVVVDKLGVPRMPGLEALYGLPQKEYMSATYMISLKGADWKKLRDAFWQQDKVERAAKYGGETYIDDNIAYGFTPVVTQYHPVNPDFINLRGLNILNQRDGEILINALQVYDVDPSRPETVQKAMDIAKQEVPHIVQLLRENIVGFEKVEVNREPRYLYIREYNHYPTEYVMQASDLLQGKMFWDNVSVASYFMDVQGSRSNRSGMAIGLPDRYGIPLRSYLLKDYDNVVLTGKLVGSTPFAYGSTRIQSNGAQAAESIGVLIAQLRGKPLKQASPHDMERLHKVMEERYKIKLESSEGKNLIEGLSEQEIADLNKGYLSLLSNAARARPFPLIRVFIDDQEIKFRGQRPLLINGSTWLPMEEIFKAAGALRVKYDMDHQRILYLMPDSLEEQSFYTHVHVLNNRILVNLRQVAEHLHLSLKWDDDRYSAILSPGDGLTHMAEQSGSGSVENK